MSYLLAFLGFAALITLHEAGHFTAAKAVGMRVERFSLFFGPMFLKRRVGETEYGVGVIPLGVPAVTMLTHTFVIYDGWDEQDTLVEVDTIHARLLVKRPGDVALYRQRWERLAQMAVTGEEAREFISGLSAGLRGRSN